MILQLAPQIAGCCLKTPEQLDLFMAEIERRLGRLSDENMVLKAEHFAAVWPVRRLECMREAVARRREILGLVKQLDHTAPNWGVKGNIRDELQHVIDKFDAVRPVVDNLHRQQDDLMKRCESPVSHLLSHTRSHFIFHLSPPPGLIFTSLTLFPVTRSWAHTLRFFAPTFSLFFYLSIYLSI